MRLVDWQGLVVVKMVMFVLEGFHLVLVMVMVNIIVSTSWRQSGFVSLFWLVLSGPHAVWVGRLVQVQRAGVDALRPRPLDVAHAEGADVPLPPLQACEGEGGDDVTGGAQVGIVW